MTTFSWGHWEETWPDGKFRCVFVEANPSSDGMIHATGLYRAAAGESFDDIDTYQDRMAERTAIAIDGNGGLLVTKEFAGLLATLPKFLQEASRRIERLGNRDNYRFAS
jgi:hypothetical protein